MEKLLVCMVKIINYLRYLRQHKHLEEIEWYGDEFEYMEK